MKKRRFNLQLLAAPIISEFEVYRSDANGNATDSGTRVAIIYSYSCDSDSATMEIKYKNVNDSDYNNTITSATGANGDGMLIPSTTFPIDEGYDFQISVSDGSSVSKRTFTLSTAIYPFSIYKTGNGVAFGKNADTDNLMDVQYAAQFRDYVNIAREVDSRGDWLMELTNAGDAGDTFIAIRAFNGNGVRFGIGVSGYNRGVYDEVKGQWIVFRDSSNDTRLSFSSSDYKPYLEAGDSTSGTFYTAGFVTTDGSAIYFQIPLTRYIAGDPDVSISGSLIVRQDGNYTHGSASGSYVTPSSWSAEANTFGVRAIATMSRTTNAVNNAPCGIVANITIRFS